VAQPVVVGKFGGVDLGNPLRRVPAKSPTVVCFAGLVEASGKGIGGHQECAAEPQITSLIDRSL
jgi:hypothetical protein